MLTNILCSGFTFAENEQHTAFRYRIFNTVMLCAMVFSALFSAMHFSGAINISDFHAEADAAYSLISLIALYLLRQSRGIYIRAVLLFLAVSYLVFVSALINAVQDEFRAIWFYLLVFVAFILASQRAALIFAALSVAALLISHYLYPQQMSQEALHSAVLGLVIFSLIANSYASKSNAYLGELTLRNNQLQELASRDHLTGTFNHRMFYELGEQMYRLSVRDSQQLGLLFIDIDYFKQINDQHDHHVGDSVLRQFATSLQASLRRSDIIARIGGEEFIILLPDTDEAGSRQIAEKLLRKIRETDIATSDGILRVTASIGLTCRLPQDQSIDDLKKRADHALYKAKDAGRNQLVYAC